MALDGALGDEQLVGDLAIAQAQHHQRQDLLLARSQRGFGDRGSQRAGDDQLPGRHGCDGRGERCQVLREDDACGAGGERPPTLVTVLSRHDGDARATAATRRAAGQVRSVTHEHCG